MEKFVLFAQPWWVNLAILIPCISYYAWRRNGLFLTAKQLIIVGLFAIGFGFGEAAVVVYLRAAIGLLPGYGGTLSDVARLSSEVYQQTQILGEFPRSLLTVERIREGATMIMLASVAFIAVRGLRERWAIFLWTFAIWDIVYYIALWATVRWPSSLTTPDVLFLSPVPWLSQVWFPILVSTLTLFAVILTPKRQNDSLC